jgi:hypothetical protein
MAWNEFFAEREIQVAKTACQDSAELPPSPCFFLVGGGGRNCPLRVCSEGTTVISQYLGAMERLYAHMRHVRNEQFRKSNWLLLH